MSTGLILASASPRRRALLEREGVVFDVRTCSVEELTHADGVPGAMVSLLNARRKAQAMRDLLLVEGLDHLCVRILAADTEVVLEDRALGKPADPEEARRMLSALSGRTHEVLTAFVLLELPSGRQVEEVVRSGVTFRSLSPAEIDAYLATGEPFDKAGAYGIQGLGGALVAHLEGSFDNVVGLPVAEVLAALKRLE